MFTDAINKTQKDSEKGKVWQRKNRKQVIYKVIQTEKVTSIFDNQHLLYMGAIKFKYVVDLHQLHTKSTSQKRKSEYLVSCMLGHSEKEKNYIFSLIFHLPCC